MTDDEVVSEPVQLYDHAFRLMEQGNPRSGSAFAAGIEKYPQGCLAAFHLRRLCNGENGAIMIMTEK